MVVGVGVGIVEQEEVDRAQLGSHAIAYKSSRVCPMTVMAAVVVFTVTR